jgi:hypothetical protein
VTQIQTMAAPELSYGPFHDLSNVRFYEITTFRIKPGYRREWMAATKAYMAATKRSAPGAAWSTYEVMAGAPGGTFLIFSSLDSFAGFDKMMNEGEATWKGMTAEESATLGKFMKEGVISVTSQHYRVEPTMSYVDAATRAKDPAFWEKKPWFVTPEGARRGAWRVPPVWTAPGYAFVGPPRRRSEAWRRHR